MDIPLFAYLLGRGLGGSRLVGRRLIWVGHRKKLPFAVVDGRLENVSRNMRHLQSVNA
jgi:hypothetical protein